MQIALIGAECTGKTQLSQTLAQALSGDARSIHVVPEFLRAWCAQQNRTPQRHEQQAIAHEQSVSVPPPSAHTVVIADTTALMTAVYSDLLFHDPSLYPLALEHQRGYDVTLVMGLDLPWVADGLQRDGPQMRAQVDTRLRQVLDTHAIRYTVVYGVGAHRTECALQAIAHHQQIPFKRGAISASNWQWNCEKCSDARCEHQLFSGLLNMRSVRN